MQEENSGSVDTFYIPLPVEFLGFQVQLTVACGPELQNLMTNSQSLI